MRRIIVAAATGVMAPRRVLLLPGAFQEPEDFLQAGFVDAVRSRGLSLDLEFIAPQLAHLLDRSILEALETQIITPARAAGCHEIWLGGISLGGLLALAYAEQRSATPDGLCLLAPYLGNRIITGEVTQAGGLRNWRPGAIAADDEERRIWAFIQRLPASDMKVYLGLGNRDRFGQGLEMFAEVLPSSAVERADGDHDWPTWRLLWDRFLDRLSLPSGSRP